MPGLLDALYGKGYSDPRIGLDSEDHTTQNVLARMQGTPEWDRDTLLPFARRFPGHEIGADPAMWGTSADVMRALDQKHGNQWQFAVPGIVQDAGQAAHDVGMSPVGAPYRMDDDAREYMLAGAGAVVGPQAAHGVFRGATAKRPSLVESLAKSPEAGILERRGELSGLAEPPPASEQRPFNHDYPGASQGPPGSPLGFDIEGRPLIARHIAGRRTVGGDDQGLSYREIGDVANRLTNGFGFSDLPNNVAGRYRAIENDIQIGRVLEKSPLDAALTLAHETGHAIDFNAVDKAGLAGPPQPALGSPASDWTAWMRAKLAPPKRNALGPMAHEDQARSIYSHLTTGKSVHDEYVAPEHFGYSPQHVPLELSAEALRAYMQNPNYMKTLAPELAAHIRDRINSHPEVSKVIQFNSDVQGPQALNVGALVGEHGARPLPMDHASRMARAESMGFRMTPVYHGTATGSDGALFDAFNPARTGGRTSGSRSGQEGVSVALNPEVANEFAWLAAQKSGGNPAVMPLLHRTERPAAIRLDGTEKNLEVAATLSDAFRDGGRDAVALKNYTTPGGRSGETAVILRDPSQLRSVNAAFDPARRHEANLLASDVQGPQAVNLGALAGEHGVNALARDAPQGIRAYHGSGADFDKFDRSFIGSQHGMEVGVSGNAPSSNAGGFHFSTSEDLAKFHRGDDGHMYEVNIKAEPTDFAHFNDRLPFQPEEVHDAFKSLGIDPMKHQTKTLGEFLKSYPGGAPALAETLKSHGVPGYAYAGAENLLAKGAKDAVNYVPFDDSLISILRKYGLLPPAAAAALAGTHQQGDAQQ